MSPDGSTNPPPEEKLLKLIRGKGPRPATETVGASQAPPRLPSRLPRGEFGSTVRMLGWSRLAVGGLSVVLLVEGSVLVVQLARPIPTLSPSRVIMSPPAPQAEPSEADGPVLALPSLATSATRPLFSSSSISASAGGVSAGGGMSGLAKQLSARLTLMGIVSGNPAQAIIEDGETKKTYFVMTGQVVVDDAVLEQVLDNRVILDLRGEKIELSL